MEQREREHRRKLATAITMLKQSDDCDFIDNTKCDRQTITAAQRTMASTPESSKDSSCDYISALSDDSGISSASSPINGQSANIDVDEKPTAHANDTKPKYIRQSTVRNVITANSSPYKSTYAPGRKSGTAPAKIITRTTSTPQIFVDGMDKAPRFQISAARKGLMQRFIATRGKVGNTTGNALYSGPSANGIGRDDSDSATISSKHHSSDDDEVAGSPNERDVSYLVSVYSRSGSNSILYGFLVCCCCSLGDHPLLTNHKSVPLIVEYQSIVSWCICYLFIFFLHGVCSTLSLSAAHRHRNN